jgi:organic hydroperoxide reductase OsmC/OhrA
MYRISLNWLRSTPDFKYETYHRAHRIHFGSGTEIEASSAPAYIGDADKVNPEETFLAALSSCHMLTFLAIAAKMRLTVDQYQDEAEAELGKNALGRVAITGVTLRPKVVFGGTPQPSADKIRELHDKAHRHCFIANSVSCPVKVEPVLVP